MSDAVTPINSLAEFQKLINGDKPIVIDFWATWCGPCRTISPVFASLASKYESVGFYKVDVDEQPDIAQEVGIRAMPTFAAFKNGEKLDSLVGAIPSALDTLLAKVAA